MPAPFSRLAILTGLALVLPLSFAPGASAATSRVAGRQPATPAPTPAAPASDPKTKPESAPESKKDAPASASPTAKPEKPGIPVGSKVSDATVLGEDGKPVKLSSLWKDGPVVITFYRGGWCPFCNKALAAWREKTAELKAAGATLVAISPETREHAHKTKDQSKTDYLTFCDDTMSAAKAFKVIFRLDDATQTKYRGYGVDLAKHNQSKEWDLPAPATFVVDQTGTVRWAFAEWDYTKRAEPGEVIKAVKALKEPAKSPQSNPVPGKPEGK